MSSSSHYTGEIAACLTTLSWAVCVFPFTASAKVLGASALNHFRLLLAVAMLFVMAAATSGKGLGFAASAGMEHWYWLGASGIVGLGLGDYFAFRSFVLAGPRLATVFSTIAPGAALLSGIFLLGESINMIGVAGMLITWIAIVVVATERSKDESAVKQRPGTKGIVFAILSAVCQGTGIVLAKKGLNSSSEMLDPVQAAWMRMVVALVALYMITIATGSWRKVHEPLFGNRRALFYGFLGTVFGPVIGVSLSMKAASNIHVSVAQTIFSLVPVVVMIISFFAGHERPGLRSVLASVVAVGGVILLVWRDDIAANI